MAQEGSARVVRERMDEPHVEGHRISVRHLHEQVEERGLTPQTVADRLGLDVADVYRALAYYHDHSDEMYAVEQRRQNRVESSREQGAVTGPDDL
ncbi:DUF433 domain-containing protein [Halosimplex marinum]|uniref:DUF433 domain-containing protein n=1 Tax=Halosimplex marinum TaxID=3396620 RepID=UPI003F5477D1